MKFYPPEKLIFIFRFTPSLIPWDFEKLVKRYYDVSFHHRAKEGQTRKKWEEENAIIIKNHAYKMKKIEEVIKRCKKAGCIITDEIDQPMKLDWDNYTSDMKDVPSVPCGDAMRKITITRAG